MRTKRNNLSKLSEQQKRNYTNFRRMVRKQYPASTAFGNFQLSQHSTTMFSVQAFNRDGKLIADWNL